MHFSHHSTFYRQNFQIFIQKPKLELPTCLVLFVNAYTLRKCQLAACNRKCHQTNFVAHFQVLAGRLLRSIISLYKSTAFRTRQPVRRIHALFRTEIRNVTRDEITIRRCFILMPYVLVKTNFSLKFGYMICLRLKYRATEKFCEIKALESYKLL